MSILINRNSRVMTQGITGNTGQFHTRTSRDYANGRACFVAGVNPKKAGENFEGIPIFGSVRDAKEQTGATVSVIYVPPPFAAAAIWEAVEADLELAICTWSRCATACGSRTARRCCLGPTARA
jgi:succinyl-CoA synthetase alpha subunit